MGKRSALVVGGSMSGLFAALMLARHGWHVEIAERAQEELAGRGAGIVAQPQIGEIFKQLSLPFGPEIGISTQVRRVYATSGKCVAEGDNPQTHTSWDRVYRMLREAFPDAHYHRGRRLTRIGQDNGKAIANFESGPAVTVDLIVGADGSRSTVRNQFAPQAQQEYAGYVAWRGLCDEAALSPTTHREMYLCMAFGEPPGEQMLGYPVAGANDDLRPGHRRYNWLWYRRADAEALNDLLTDDNGVTHAGGIPPPLVRGELIAALHRAGEQHAPPQFREVFARSARPFLQPIYDLETPNMAFGRVALVGDAAFVARPHVGGGVAKGAHDAAVLAEMLSRHDNVEAGLRAFEAARLPVGRKTVRRSRALGAYIQPTLHSPAEIADAKRFGGHDTLLYEIATLNFLADTD